MKDVSLRNYDFIYVYCFVKKLNMNWQILIKDMRNFLVTCNFTDGAALHIMMNINHFCPIIWLFSLNFTSFTLYKSLNQPMADFGDHFYSQFLSIKTIMFMHLPVPWCHWFNYQVYLAGIWMTCVSRIFSHPTKHLSCLKIFT